MKEDVFVKRSIQRLAIPLIVLLMMGGMIPLSAIAEAVPSVSYCTHVQNVGWQNYVGDGEMSGTEGKSYRLEGIKIKLDAQGYDLGISYQTHIQNIGWEADTSAGWKASDAISGTEGISYRLEAIQIKLTGADAEKYDIYYQVHAQNMGWLGWAKNGESAGTAGFGYRLEGIRIVIVPVGSAVPNGNVDKEDSYYENPLAPYAKILEEYKQAEVNGYSGKLIVDSLHNVNLELSSTYKDTTLFYSLEDLSGDAVPELVISGYSPSISRYTIFDMYRLNGSGPERIFNIKSMGYRAIYTICENNIIGMSGSGGANTHYYRFYSLDANTSTEVQYVRFEKPNYYLTDVSHNNIQIQKDDAFAIIDSYIPRPDVNWIKI